MATLQTSREFIAILSCALFAGGAVYINTVEHPARMSCGTEAAVTEWVLSYKRATWMQAPLAIVGFVCAIEGGSHPDLDLQFRHIKNTCAAFEKWGDLIISVDCKKKELIGNFKNRGREWHGKGANTVVNVYDFLNLGDGKATPYGVYDTLRKLGFVNVGIDHDTAQFAVESIRRWWKATGRALYTQSERLITSDGGGSNGVRSRLWKVELQKFANETGLSVTVNHLPPATSKWNKIEHRLFSYISVNWRGRPLTSLETIIELISATTTAQGLTVQAVVDQNRYPTGIKVSDVEMAALNIVRDAFHGEWNYTLKPQ